MSNNCLTSLGLTVGSSSVLNIGKNFGYGVIFSGFGSSIDSTGTADQWHTLLPELSIGELRKITITSASSGTAIYLPSGGVYFALLPSESVDEYIVKTPSGFHVTNLQYSHSSTSDSMFPILATAYTFSVGEGDLIYYMRVA